MNFAYNSKYGKGRYYKNRYKYYKYEYRSRNNATENADQPNDNSAIKKGNTKAKNQEGKK